MTDNKEILYKIFESDGTFVTTWIDVISDLSFIETINGGLSELKVELGRKESEYGEGDDVKFGNLIEVWVFDKDDSVGVQVYGGILTSYIPKVDGSKETVEVVFLSYHWELNQYILEVAGDTEVDYLTQDPTVIFRDLLDKFTAAGGTADHKTGTTTLTATSVSYTFNTITYQGALKKVLELCPENWYYRVGADGTVYMDEKSATAEHTFTIGKEISFYVPEKRTDAIVNTIYFRGGDTGGGVMLYKKFTNSGSITNFGIRAISVIDSRVTVEATANTICNRILDEKNASEIRVQVKILDDNGEVGEMGYDIETIHVGQTCEIKNATDKGYNLWDVMLWDEDAWDYEITNASSIILQIMRIEYNPNYVILELSNRQPDIAKRIEDINRNLDNEQTKDNPTTPTT